MKIELHEIPLRDAAEGCIDNEEEGVIGAGACGDGCSSDILIEIGGG